MLKFNEFFNSRQIFDAELFIEGVIEDIESHEPLDGHWKTPPDAYGQSQYVFNVAGEEDCSSYSPCYTVKFYGSTSGTTSISFNRNSSHDDTNLGNQKEVIRGVLKAIIKYVKDTNPIGLDWTPVDKTKVNARTGDYVNKNAREVIYRGWAVRHLFPDKYVGGLNIPGHDSNIWIRKDIYDKTLVPLGMPPVPEGIHDDAPSGEKMQILSGMNKQLAEKFGGLNSHEKEMLGYEFRNKLSSAAYEEYTKRKETERKRKEEEARIKKEKLAAAIVSQEYNPAGLKDGDYVYVKNVGANLSPELGELRGVIRDFQFNDSHLSAQVAFARNDDDNYFNGSVNWIPVNNLMKEGPEHAEKRMLRRRERTEALKHDPGINPGGIDEGDEIITKIEGYPGSRHHGLLGKVKEIFLSRDGRSLMANVDWTDEAKAVLGSDSQRPVHLSNFLKATPENKELILNQKRQHQIDQQVQNTRDRETRRQARQRSYQPISNSNQTPEQLERLINHPKNPLHLKPGDMIVVGNDWRNSGRRGVILSLQSPHWNDDSISATVKFHGSSARPTNFWSLDNLQRDTSPESQAMIARQQQQAARQQRIASAVGGLNVGDTVTVSQGRNRGRSGTIISFRSSGQNVSAVIGARDGNFTADIRYIQNPQPPQTESLSFFQYYLGRNQYTICEKHPTF